MVQRYSLSNHIHWVTEGTPQAGPELGRQMIRLVPDTAAPSTFAAELGEWLVRIDGEYRALLQRHDRAEAMAFVGALA